MIHARALARSFTSRRRTVEAVRGVDLDVDTGELVGFLGPNGAGKTTTLRLLTTVLSPTAGTATVAGHDLVRDPASVRRSIGYIAQGNGCGLDQRVDHELVLQGELHGLSRHEASRHTAELLARFDLTEAAGRVAGTLSGGQRRRVDIAMGVLHRPPLVFLDEPSAGLDPQSRGNLWAHVRDLRDTYGTTVFLTTHYLEEADELCDRIFVIDDGRIVATGTPNELKAGVSGDLVSVDVDRPDLAVAVAAALPGTTDVEPAGQRVTFRVPRGDTALPLLLRDLNRAGVTVSSVQTHRPTLDDVFLTLTGRSLREPDGAAAAA
ncbi:MAG: ATP-binding cassette domain-containing protein [Streptosporangiales bacterium]|nr:ATP-binding cassette domain-containing protein [Streptosporangiales bacterium]